VALCGGVVLRPFHFLLPLFTELRGRRIPERPLSRICISSHSSGRVSYTSMGEFYSDLKSILGPRMLWEVVLGMRRNDLLWLYVTGLMVLLGLEINAVLARMAEERKGIELVQTE
jgi:hypothetical protein